MKTECFEDVKQEELLDQSHELEIQTHKQRTYPSSWTLAPAAPSNGSLAPPGDTEPGRKAETSLAPPAFASYLVLGKEGSAKVHSHTNPANKKAITAPLSCTAQPENDNFLGHISLSLSYPVMRWKILHHTNRESHDILSYAALQAWPFRPKNALPLLPLLLFTKLTPLIKVLLVATETQSKQNRHPKNIYLKPQLVSEESALSYQVASSQDFPHPY